MIDINNSASAVTKEGFLKIAQDELSYLEGYLARNDRCGYYVALYQMTGNPQCLEQAQVASFSQGIGGSAWLANYLLQTGLGVLGIIRQAFRVRGDLYDGEKYAAVNVGFFARIGYQTNSRSKNYEFR